MSEPQLSVYCGNVIHCNKPFVVEVLSDYFIAVNQNKIVAIDTISNLKSFKEEQDLNNFEEVVLNEYQILIPGLIDTHNHACQYSNIGLGLNKSLKEWLDTHTFPLEQSFGDVEFAKKCYEAVVKNTLNHGTTTAAYNTTTHVDTSLILADIAIAHGQRAFIGKVNVTENCPTDVCETGSTTLKKTERFINEMLKKNSSLVRPIISPSHPLRVSIDVMKHLTNLAKTHNLLVQTHMCECKNEREKALELYDKPFSTVLSEGGVLTNKTIVAHAIHTSSEKIGLLAKHKTSVAHCPGSNFNLLSGVCDVKALFKAGIDVGLGTDISAGSSVGIADQMRNALIASSTFYFNNNNYKPINCFDVFYMATLGGAKALSIDKVVGNFEVGKDFDALIVDMNVKNGNSVCLEKYQPLELLQKFIYLGDDRNIISVYVAGRKVK